MKLSRKALVSIILSCAVVSCFVAYGNAIRKDEARLKSEVLKRFGGEVTKVATAKTELHEGDVIDSSTVEMKEWASDLVPEDSITDLKQIEGQKVTIPLAKGMPVGKLTVQKQAQELDIPSGHVAVYVTGFEKLISSGDALCESKLSLYEARDNSVKLITTEAKLLRNDPKSNVLLIAILPQDISQVLRASTSQTLRMVFFGKGVEADSLKENTAPQEVKREEVEEHHD